MCSASRSILFIFAISLGLRPAVAAPAECSPESRALEQAWLEQEPPHPRILDLARALAVFRAERTTVDRLNDDKLKHCYVGCVVAGRVNLETATYLGWLKEHWDLTDCDQRTRFEEADERATAIGAEIGVRSPRQECPARCRHALK